MALAAKKAGEKPPATAPAVAPATPPVEPKPAKAEPKRISLPKIQSEPEPAPVTAPPTPKSHDELVGEALSADVRDHLDTVRFASENDPAYKGYYEREVERFKKLAAAKKKWEVDHPGEPMDAENEEIQSVLKAHPSTLTAHEQKVLERARIKHEAVAEAKRETHKSQVDTNQRIAEVKYRPFIDKARDATIEGIKDLIPDRLKNTPFDELPSDPEGKIVHRIAKQGSTMVETFLSVISGVEPVDLERNQRHIQTAEFIDNAAKFYKEEGKNLIRDGKKFVSRFEFGRLSESERDKHWTFSNDDIVEIIQRNTHAMAKTELETERTQWSKVLGGSATPPASVQSSATPDVQEPPSPRSTVAPTSPNGEAPKTGSAHPFAKHILSKAS